MSLQRAFLPEASTEQDGLVGRVPIRPAPSTNTRASSAPRAVAPERPAAPLSLRAKLEVGGANDPVERAADRAADAAMRHLSGASPASPASPSTMSMPASTIARSATDSSSPGLTASPAIEQTIGARSGGGSPLGDVVRGRMEQAFGSDFSSVRIHDDAEAGAVSRSLGAQAFTSGSDIYFSSGSFTADRPDGERLLAHELAHVVQQQGRSDGPIRRKIGFELEDNQWESYMKVDKQPLHPPDPTNIWDRSSAGHIDTTLGPLGVAAFAKKDKLHQGAGWALEADGPYRQGKMDIEFVTKPFDTDKAGMIQMLRAFDEMDKLMTHLTSMKPMPRSAESGQFFTAKEHALSNPDVLLAGGAPTAAFKPQVTHGVDLSKVPDLFRAFGKPEDESDKEKNDRSGARQLMGDNLGLQQKILGAAPDQADVVVNQMQNIGYIPDDADVGRLTGFVTFLLTYVQCLQVMPWDGLKVALPFLSRYDFVKLLSMVPDDQADVIKGRGRDTFIEIIDMTLARDGVVNEKRSKALTPDRPMMEFVGQKGIPQKKVAFYQMIEDLTTRDFITGILDGEDRLTPQGLKDHLGEQGNDTDSYDKSLKIFGRGHGATKTLTDVTDDKAIMENRAIDPGDKMDMAAARMLAVRYFVYIQNLEGGKNRFPGGSVD